CHSPFFVVATKLVDEFWPEVIDETSVTATNANKKRSKGGWHFRGKVPATFLRLLGASSNRLGCAASSIEIIPVQDRVKAEEEIPLRLPAPERSIGKHHDVTLADRRIERDGATGQRVATDQHSGQQQIVRVGRERQQHARGI